MVRDGTRVYSPISADDYKVATARSHPLPFRDSNLPPLLTTFDPTKRWLEFGEELKMRRDKILAVGGYWLPYDLSSSGEEKWIPLTKQVETELLAGETPPILLRCPVCGTRSNVYEEMGTEVSPYSGRKLSVRHLDRMYPCTVYERSLPYNTFAQYQNDLRDLVANFSDIKV